MSMGYDGGQMRTERSSVQARQRLIALICLLLTVSGCTAVISGRGSGDTSVAAALAADLAAVSSSARSSASLASSSAASSSSSSAASAAAESSAASVAASLASEAARPKVRPSSVDTSALFESITNALLVGNREAFLLHFTSEALVPATFWWDNMAAIGMDGGAASTYYSDAAMIDVGANDVGTVRQVFMGAHFPGDGADEFNNLRVSTTAYSWDVAASFDPTFEVTSLIVTAWTSLSNAPWDCNCALHVARGVSGVVASLPDDAAFADEILNYQDQGYEWLNNFMTLSAPEIGVPAEVVTFATANADRLYNWFRPLSDGTAEVPVDRSFVAAVQATYSYYGFNPNLAWAVPNTAPRMVVGSDVLDFADPVDVLVHELVHYSLGKFRNEEYWPYTEPYLAEGVAEMIEQVYGFTTPADAVAGAWVVGQPRQATSISASLLAELFDGSLPTSDEMRSGSNSVVNFWYDIAGSLYNYLALTYGMPAALRASVCAYKEGTVLGCVTDDAGVRLSEADLTASWAQWVRATYG
ncbi:hypothetical protein EH165_14545 [Nakamurella antarctica]|uniref:Uncharacterized protein n=1 Tax=Nakamurella antarctica TaxID=1902245 RepID=A0A3G8ZQU7_9ACTN|nr:hypothetical protein [Nakamurella antarctica]AZI59177.1 hypothetical protein EH165_14545 [Nakamurella antarctica]